MKREEPEYRRGSRWIPKTGNPTALSWSRHDSQAKLDSSRLVSSRFKTSRETAETEQEDRHVPAVISGIFRISTLSRDLCWAFIWQTFRISREVLFGVHRVSAYTERLRINRSSSTRTSERLQLPRPQRPPTSSARSFHGDLDLHAFPRELRRSWQEFILPSTRLASTTRFYAAATAAKRNRKRTERERTRARD